MRKKVIINSLLVGSGLLSLALGGPNAEAKVFNGESDTKVEFQKGTIVIPPVEPPVEPPITPPDSDFGLLYVPKEFNFKTTTVPATPTQLTIAVDPTIESSSGANPLTKHVALADLRGTYVGWKLEAKMTTLKGTVDTSRELTGATITMAQELKEITDPSQNTLAAVVSTAQQPDLVTGAITLNNANTTIQSAASGKGQGYWAGEFTNIQLIIPAAVSPVVNESYVGTVDWTLTDSI